MQYTEEQKKDLIRKIKANRNSGMSMKEATKAAGLNTCTYWKWTKGAQPKVVIHESPKQRKVMKKKQSQFAGSRLMVIYGDVDQVMEVARGLA